MTDSTGPDPADTTYTYRGGADIMTTWTLIRALRQHGSPGSLTWSTPAWRYAWAVWRRPGRYLALLEHMTAGRHRRLDRDYCWDIRRCGTCQTLCLSPVAGLCVCCQRVFTRKPR